MYILGLDRLGVREYADARNATKRDPYITRQPMLERYMALYPRWRELFDGRALEETIPSSSPDDTTVYRWPVRFNLIKSYCMLHAGMLWGRGKPGYEGDLFTVRVKPDRPGLAQPAAPSASRLQEILQHFWSQQAHVLQLNGITQQWAGGCIIKVSWNPWSPSAVYGIVLETIQPEHFFPLWDPTNFTDLYAVKVRFTVQKEVALEKYGVTPEELSHFADADAVPVEEYWSRDRYAVVVGKREPGDAGVVARRPNGERMEGANPWIHPGFGRGLIPYVYIPRVRTSGFLGDSLAYDLEGLQAEANKTLADYGDALTRGSHPAFGISDYDGKGSVIPIPRHGALNLGKTRPGGQPPKVHDFPMPQVPPQTGEYLDKLLSLSETQVGLTPAARGVSQGAKSSLVIALELLPTTNLIEAVRANWANGIAGGGGIDLVMEAIWFAKRGLSMVPTITETMFTLQQAIEFRPVVPKDHQETIDEVVRLATVNAVSPEEWLRRLGDIEDIDAELERIRDYLIFLAEKEAAVAGRAIKVVETTNPEGAPRAWPSISGETVEPNPDKQAAKEPEGLPRRQG